MTESETRPASALNIANALTVLRIAMVPFFIWFLLADSAEYSWWRWAALLVFAAAIYTDKLDGDLARSRGLITNFGKIADPIADKLLIGSALIILSTLGELSWWITLPILIREVGITLLRFVVIRYGVIPASRGGKLKTVLQTAAILLYLLPLTPQWPWLGVVALSVMLAAFVVTLWTGVDYIVQAVRLRRSSAAEGTAR
ncbi:CDP-diacylglycerol--glycerol-3-phosphate 3-phosphatidyltransferase [Psychromicrobium sp. YIM B11713]|uniref:CDP-diacylglycerol--glycerol-3-phosphate 3-phosphatidyltransferase n=1 Tax=Psychromicrobium sp. YIM B11713 TaxID=3145233 RepID=UPI00374F8DA8